MCPGNHSKVLKNLKMDDRQLVWTEAIINSMNKNERKTQILLMEVVD